MNQRIFKTNLIAIILVLAGAMNWAFAVFNINPVKSLSTLVKLPILEKVVYALVGLAGLFLIFKRDTYLPFLGQSAFPCGVIGLSKPENATDSVSVNVTPNTKVVYWAAEKGDTNRSPKDAYGDVSNSGVVLSDKDGNAKLDIRPTSGYKAGGRTLKSHVHFRECTPSMLGEVRTKLMPN